MPSIYDQWKKGEFDSCQQKRNPDGTKTITMVKGNEVTELVLVEKIKETKPVKREKYNENTGKVEQL